MNRLILFTLLFSFSKIFACGPYYPMGEEVRISINNPSNWGFNDYFPFFYSGYIFNSEYESEEIIENKTLTLGANQNIELWRKMIKNNVSAESIKTILYNKVDFESSTNEFIVYLKQNNEQDILNYLKFLKKTEDFNSFKLSETLWEIDGKESENNNFIQEAIEKSAKVKNKEIKRRYQFLAIRLAFYKNDSKQVKNLYEFYFSKRKEKDILDYWAMHFYTSTIKNKVEKNYYASLVFANAPEKRFANYTQQFNFKTDIDSTLALTKSIQEKSTIYFLHGINNPGKALDFIKKIYKIQPKNNQLDFLLVRELSKLEDWIYTPYFTNFNPALFVDEIEYGSNNYLERKKKASENRFKNDLKYANEVLDFINSTNLENMHNPALWKYAKASILGMFGNYSEGIQQLNLIGNQNNIEISYQINVLKSYFLIANQKENETIFLPEVQKIVQGEWKKQNFKYVFVIARALEYKNNTTDAALLFSKIGIYEKENNENYYNQNTVYWMTKNFAQVDYVDYFNKDMRYLDAEYSPEMIQKLIASTENHENNEYNNWLYNEAKNKLSLYYDMLGTKFIRQNNLKSALENFKKVPDSIYKSDKHPFQFYLNANPFHTNMYNEHKAVKQDYQNDKAKITQNLIKYLSLAENPKTKNRDYYYFIVANAYLNMTFNGNCWMMRRYYWTSNDIKDFLEDEREYNDANLAKKYYLKAKVHSKTRNFAALCLRMAGRCEKYKIINAFAKIPYDENSGYSKMSWDEHQDYVFDKNPYYAQIEKEYPETYEDLIYNCQSFERYFQSRVAK